LLTLERLLAGAMRDRAVLDYLREALTSDLVVANPHYLSVARFVSDFADTHGALPKQGDYDVWLDTLATGQRGAVQQALGLLRQQDVSGYTLEYVASQAIGDLRSIALHNAVARLNAMQDKATPETLATLAAQVSGIEPVSIKGLAQLSDVDRWVMPDPIEDAIPTGVHALDSYIGGWRNELVFVLADSGLGKTAGLINFGMAAAFSGASVLHVTMELSTKHTLQRYYRRIAEANRQTFVQHTDQVAGRVRHWLGYAKGSVAVLFVEPYTLGAPDLERLLSVYTRMYGPVNMLILDYLDLMLGPKERGISDYARLGRVSHAVRGMCVGKFHCTAISATQARKQRGTTPRERLQLADMGDSYEKVRAADIIVSLNQNEAEEEANQARYGLLKVRESSGRNAEIPVYYNMDLMLLAGLDETNTRRIMDSLGHRPLVQEPEEEAAA